ncbi:MAG: patatin-like phospholipase family protein [Candidatus Omnitrophica bacterium]|nr:patatin-like phospholipase family protein [Candidatus Omnitrophota bacterium]
MKPIDKDLILKEIPLFNDLSSRELKQVKERSEIKEYKKGEVIYREGSGADAFYCIVLGRVLAYTLGVLGQETAIEHLHHGKYFGIISLLTGDYHSVSTRVLNDSSLLVIKKQDFDFLLKKIPRLALHLSRTLSRRLKNRSIHQKIIFESTIISAFSSYSQAGKTVYALNLALSLYRETGKSVVILDIAPLNKAHTLPERLEVMDNRAFDLSESAGNDYRIVKDFISKTKFGVDLICSHYDPKDESCVKKVVGILSSLVNDYHYIILDLPSAIDRCIFSILNQSDLISILSGPDSSALRKTYNLIRGLKADFNFEPNKIKIIINEYKTSGLTHKEQGVALNNNIFATLPQIVAQPDDRLVLSSPDCEYARAIRRIARQLGDCLVGLVLGVGVGYGFCHIGVLRVIEEEKIPIDIISGSSVGALIASLWATGRSSDEILEIAKEFKEPKHLWGLIDLTFPLMGFIKGKKLYSFLKRHFANKTFNDLRLPLQIIACDLKKKQYRVLNTGLLADAIMASCTMPGVFTPFKFKEEMLFDGGISNPLPTEPLLKMGVKKIIAANVTPSREDVIRQYRKIKDGLVVKKAKNRGWAYLKQLIKSRFKINILDIIFSSIEILQSEVAQKEAQLADVVLHPDTSGLYWLELHRGEEFARRGEEEARKHLDKIWQIIKE